MSAQVLCFASAKGGSGKTSLLATVATFLSKLNKKTLIIDSDFATSGLTLLYLKEVKLKAELVHSKSLLPAGLSKALVLNTHADIVELNANLHFIPATFDLQAGLESPSEEIKRRFYSLLLALRSEYDYIFIDAQAGADEMGRIAMSRNISDEVVIVSEYDPMSAAGVERLKALLREDLTYDRTWVLLNKILPEFAKSFSDFMEVAKYLSPIPWDAAVVRAYSRRQLAIDSDAGSEHTLAIIQMLRGLFGEAIKDELNSWVQSRAAVIRQPLEQQYADAEKEIFYLLSQREQIKRKRDTLRLAVTSLITATGAFVLAYAVGGYTDGTISLKETIFVLAPLFGIVLGTIALFSKTDVLGLIFRDTRAEREILEMRFNRQIELLQSRLKRLELLRSLDPESLIVSPEVRKEQ